MSLFYIDCDCGEKIPKNGDIGAPPRKKPKFWGFGLRDELPPYDRKCPKCGAEYKKYWIIDQIYDIGAFFILPLAFLLAHWIYALLPKIYYLLAFIIILVILITIAILMDITQPYKRNEFIKTS